MANKLKSADDFLALLQGVRRTGDGQYMARCPAHDDQKASLSIKVTDDRILVKCHAGCELVNVLQPLGLKPADLFFKRDNPGQHQERGQIERVYPYVAAHGKPYETVRFKNPKGFKQRQPDGKGGYIWTLNGIKRTALTLYHQDELGPAIANGAIVFVVEGEKDVDRLRSLGCVATTNPMGAGKWHEHYSEALRGADIAVIPDNDEPGLQHAEKVARSCYGVAQRVRVLRLPVTDKGGDVSDWLDQGGTIEGLRELLRGCPQYKPDRQDSAEKQPPQKPEASEPLPVERSEYCEHDGEMCRLKTTSSGRTIVPLCNFTAEIVKELVEDNGFETSRKLTVTGSLKQRTLPPAEVPAASFGRLDWVMKEWGAKLIIRAGQGTRDHLAAAIQLRSNGIRRETVYAHTGWRDLDGERVFLSGSGALGKDNVQVRLSGPLARYRLPEALADVEPATAVAASLRFLGVTSPEVGYPLWGCMYLAPLCELVEPAFILWLTGHTGSFKSVLSALALSHFGDFSHTTLPASWQDTVNFLEYAAAILKDVPLVIDDYYPAGAPAAQRDMVAKAQAVVRAQGNRAGRGRLRPDATAREKYIPRGIAISSGEQAPGGESGSSRLLECLVERTDTDLGKLTAAQGERSLYGHAMARYILWLASDWDFVTKYLRQQLPLWRQKALSAKGHPRLPVVVAALYAGLDLAFSFAVEVGVLGAEEAETRKAEGWDALVRLAEAQASTVEEERPAARFLEGLQALFMQQRAVLISRKSAEPMPGELKQGQVLIGWREHDWLYLSLVLAAREVQTFWEHTTTPMMFSRRAIVADLKRLGLIETDKRTGRNTVVIWVGTRDESHPERVLKLRASALRTEWPSESLPGVSENV